MRSASRGGNLPKDRAKLITNQLYEICHTRLYYLSQHSTEYEKGQGRSGVDEDFDVAGNQA